MAMQVGGGPRENEQLERRKPVQASPRIDLAEEPNAELGRAERVPPIEQDPGPAELRCRT